MDKLFDIKQYNNQAIGLGHEKAVDLDSRPSTVISLLKSVVMQRPTPNGELAVPALRSHQDSLRLGRSRAENFAYICGLEPSALLNAVLLHSLCFAHHLHLLTDSRMPLKAHTMLQVRNHIILCRALPVDEPLEIRTAILERRPTAKGVEVDVGSWALAGGEPLWANRCAYFFALRHGLEPSTPPASAGFEPLDGPSRATGWKVERHAWRFARLSGDYNGIHLSRRYARMMGFADSFSHSQPLLANCLQRVGGGGESFRLDAALKGPVSYGQEASIAIGHGGRFDLMAQDNDRPVITGRYHALSPDEAGDIGEDWKDVV